MGLDRESQQIGLICPSGNQIDPIQPIMRSAQGGLARRPRASHDEYNRWASQWIGCGKPVED
jgi:hypothetical protein